MPQARAAAGALAVPVQRAGVRVRDWTAAWQCLIGCLLLLAWEAVGRTGGERWVSRPSLVFARIAGWLGGNLYLQVGTTLSELAIGLLIGSVVGTAAGLALGRAPLAAIILRPMIVGLYSVPLVALAPLFIMFFGLGLLPKIVLVGVVVFFLMFFNTFAGAQAVDRDLIAAMQIMGATRREVFWKAVLPGSVVWIMAGLKVALPYAMVAAITGEMLASRYGLGQMLSQAGERFDMTALFAVLLILLLIGIALSSGFARFERHVLRWRQNGG